jgi:branched-chain amino acid transport system substrate-binding protein
MRMMGTRSITAAAALGVISAFALGTGCGHSAPTGILIGEYGSMTGQQATFGTSTDNGIKMALAEINANGGVDGSKIALQSYDDQGASDQARAVVTRII